MNPIAPAQAATVKVCHGKEESPALCMAGERAAAVDVREITREKAHPYSLRSEPGCGLIQLF